MQKAKKMETLKREFGVRECSVILQKSQNETIVGRGEGSEAHRYNQQPEANAGSNCHAHFLVEMLEKSRNLNHIVVPERPSIPRVSLPEVELRDAFQRQLQLAPPQKESIHKRIMGEIKQKLDSKLL